MTVSCDADNVEYSATAEDVANACLSLANCDLEQDVIFAEVNGEFIGYGRCFWYLEANDGPYLYDFLVAVVPEWRRQGIGQVLLRWLESRLRTIAAEHPGEHSKFLQSCTAHGHVGTETMLEEEGYKPVRYSNEMHRETLDDIPNFPMPAGLEVRPVLPEHYRAIWGTAEEASQDHWGYTPSTEEQYQAWLIHKTVFQPHLWQIAWDVETDQIAGQVRTFINHAQNEKYDCKRGFTEFICVRRPWRRRGLARALISLSLKVQKEQGMTESVLGVDSENISGANRLYEDCGFRVVKRHSVYRKLL
ncbi:Mycothiol acetyltransferase [Acaryochloris thomasi RCC1774]|uniref:Mycothiol acetyltransferase n=1 Tax=Acaryochloris thomasi RCC1774 TaxID=1764569 RepID=A0A2W1JPF0_9CYAN|nr:GNAT family N-acetyltransferase [Acaryochloris thomasi]PZD75193.1 Mycothiol acetyltransferase [Acaryochloris thomasi RCC1774]